MMIYHGTGVSRGVAAGPLYCYEPFVPAPPCAGHGGSAGEQRALYEAGQAHRPRRAGRGVRPAGGRQGRHLRGAYGYPGR